MYQLILLIKVGEVLARVTSYITIKQLISARSTGSVSYAAASMLLFLVDVAYYNYIVLLEIETNVIVTLGILGLLLFKSGIVLLFVSRVALVESKIRTSIHSKYSGMALALLLLDLLFYLSLID